MIITSDPKKVLLHYSYARMTHSNIRNRMCETWRHSNIRKTSECATYYTNFVVSFQRSLLPCSHWCVRIRVGRRELLRATDKDVRLMRNHRHDAETVVDGVICRFFCCCVACWRLSNWFVSKTLLDLFLGCSLPLNRESVCFLIKISAWTVNIPLHGADWSCHLRFGKMLV